MALITSFKSLEILQILVILGGVLLIHSTLRRNARLRDIANSIKLSEHHRALWEPLLSEPQLGRILDSSTNLTQRPITPAEEMFVVFITLHLSDTYYAMKVGFYQRPEGLANDINRFYSLPVPRKVWTKIKDLQESDFAEFVEGCLERDDLA